MNTNEDDQRCTNLLVDQLVDWITEKILALGQIQGGNAKMLSEVETVLRNSIRFVSEEYDRRLEDARRDKEDADQILASTTSKLEREIEKYRQRAESLSVRVKELETTVDPTRLSALLSDERDRTRESSAKEISDLRRENEGLKRNNEALSGAKRKLRDALERSKGKR